MSPETMLAEALWSTIESHRVRRVPLSELLKAGAAVDRTGAAMVGWRARIKVAIDHLEASGRVTLPKTKQDTTALPALPLYVTRAAAARAPRPAAAAPVWHVELRWAAALFDDGKLTRSDQRFLATINSWLSRRRGIAVPLRERSLEIFGDEKLLETRVSGPLFGPGRLNLDVLQTYLCWPAVERFAFGPGDWLIVENYTTYHSLGHRARELGFDGHIIWGSGNGVGTRLAALAAEPARPPRIYYFGDIDGGGFRIARSAANRAAALGLPPLLAASGLYRLALEAGECRSDTNTRNADPTLPGWICRWLDPALADALVGVLTARQRIVQETVGRELLANTELGQWF